MPPELIEALKIGSMPLLLGYMWWRAETRADRERELNQTLAREMITTSVKFEAAVTTLAQILTGRKNGNGA